MNRIDRRDSDELRPVAFDLGIAPYAGGSVLVTMGNTRVICGATIEENVRRAFLFAQAQVASAK